MGPRRRASAFETGAAVGAAVGAAEAEGEDDVDDVFLGRTLQQLARRERTLSSLRVQVRLLEVARLIASDYERTLCACRWLSPSRQPFASFADRLPITSSSPPHRLFIAGRFDRLGRYLSMRSCSRPSECTRRVPAR